MAESRTSSPGISLPTNQCSVNTVYMEHIPLATAGSTSWYEYNSFNNLLVTPAVPTPILALPQQTKEVILQPAGTTITAKTKTGTRIKPRISIHERIYCCEDCGAAFSNSSNLKSHIRIHSGDRPYVCSDCGVSFTQSSNLKAHKRVHTGERPYSCLECGQTFSRSSHLIGHKRTHTGERPYICGVCKHDFVTSTHLRNHMRKHTGEKPFICNICETAFAQNASLQIHMRIHTGERPYKCLECVASFRSQGDLRSHKKLHTEERPFKCNRCTKTFKTFQYLQKHFKKCGAPPSGKKRGRPRKSTSIEALSSVSSERKNTSPEKAKLKGKRGGHSKPLEIDSNNITRPNVDPNPSDINVEGDIINREILEEDFDEEELATTLASMSDMEGVHEEMKSLGHNLSELGPLEPRAATEASIVRTDVNHVELKHDVKHVIQLSDLQQLQIHEPLGSQHAKQQHVYEVTLQPQGNMQHQQTIHSPQLTHVASHTQPHVITIQIHSQNPQPSHQLHLPTTVAHLTASDSNQVLDQITQSLPELKNPDDTFGEINTTALEQLDPSSDPLHITNVEHIEHTQAVDEHIERIVHVVQY